MRAFLARRWFLIALTTGVAVALRWPTPILAATGSLPPYLVIAIAVFITSWTMPTRSLGDEIRSPTAAIWSLVISYLFLPILGYCLGVFSPNPDFRVGLLLSASVPCTLASSVLWTRMAEGNEATALCSVLGSTMISWFATTAWLTATTGTNVELDAARMMLDLVFALILPVALGQAFRLPTACREFADRRRGWLTAFGQTFILAMVLKTSAQVGRKVMDGSTNVTWADIAISGSLAMSLHVAALYFGFWTSRWLGFDVARQRAIAFCGSQKTLPVSILLFEKYFEEAFPLAIIAVLFFHVGQLLLDTLIAERMKRTTSVMEMTKKS